MIKSRMIKWARYVARMREKMNAYGILVGKPEGKRPLEDQEVGGWIILRRILERYGGVIFVVSCEHGNEPSVSIKWWEVLE
jgi:hypothetical protein